MHEGQKEPCGIYIQFPHGSFFVLRKCCCTYAHALFKLLKTCCDQDV
jgi:hypothetical protein